MRSALIPTLFLLSSTLPAQVPSLAARPKVETVPGKVLVERGKSQSHLNFDFRITNPGTTPALLDRIGIRVLDSRGVLVLRKYVDRGGTAPGLDTVLPSPIPPGEMVHAFNPYHSFELDVDLAKLEYELVFRDPSTYRLLGRVQHTIEPVHYETQAMLHLPVPGRVLVRDGHDFLSHHRRVGLDLPMLRSLGLKTNSSRYGYDFVRIDEEGEMFRNSGGRFEDWYGWDAPILAPAAGMVAAVFNDFPDNTLTPSGTVRRNPRVVPTDLDTFAGNYVVLDHGHGEYSIFGHLRAGSVRVRVGQEVAQGEVLASMGLSGATDHVHLHYQLQDGAHLWDSEGLPSPFQNYLLHLGSETRHVDRGQIDSGDIVEANGIK